MKTRLLKTGKQFLLAILFIVVFSSCNHTRPQKLENLPMKEQLIEDILVEMYLLEGKTKVYLYQTTPDSLKVWVNNEVEQLFKRYNTNYKQFSDSYFHYMGDALMSKKIMTNVTNRLILLQTEQIGNSKQIDSLNKKK
jgi:hypothetical protein